MSVRWSRVCAVLLISAPIVCGLALAWVVAP